MALKTSARIATGSIRSGVLEVFGSWGFLPLIVIAFFVFFGLYEERFWRLTNLINVLRNSSYLMIISAGQMLVLIIGGFDLSVGAVVALSSVCAAFAMIELQVFFPGAAVLVIILGTAAALAVGAAVGIANGLTVALLRVSPFMVTLGTMSIATGIALHVTAGIPIYGMPEEFVREFGRRLRWFGLPVSIYVTGVLLFAIWWMMNWTRLGRYIYAIGSNQHAARVSGISTTRYIVTTYALCSVLAALTGVLLTARVGSGEATLGASLMLESIAAAVIGGVSLRGGVGRVGLVALGALLLALVTNGANLMQIDSKVQTIVIGVVLIATVGIDNLKLGGRRK